MGINDWLKINERRLSDAGIGTARLDCLVLLEDALGKDRTHLLAHPDIELSKAQKSLLDEHVQRRAGHEPLAYIRGKSEFYGRDFMVNADTLEPRPETETMIELALNILDKKCLILDIGTGSGAIAITMKLERPDYQVVATDVSEECLRIARRNARDLGADISLLHGDLLEPLSDIKYQISSIVIMANLPYVPERYELNAAAKFEPRVAIFGGEDGLDPYRRLFSQIDALPDRPTHIFTESLPFQHERLAEIANQHSYAQADVDDFIQHFTNGQ